MRTKVDAVGHRIIVRPDPVTTKTESGIVLAKDVTRERAGAQKGTVIGVGPMAWKNEVYGFGLEGWKPWCKVGDRVYFARYAGKQLCLVDGPEAVEEDWIMVMNDEDIQCLITEE